MNGRIRLNAVGDVMLGDFPLTLGFGVLSSIRKGLVENPFNKIMHVLKACDICFGNLETVLSEHGYIDNDIQSSQMRGDSRSVKLLKEAGFNVMSIANNHAMQHGPEAFKETKEGLIRNAIAPIGIAGQDKRCLPHFLEINDIRICFLAYSLRPEKYCSEILYAHSNISEVIEDVKFNKRRSDVVIVSLHWGDEFVRVPSPEQIRNGRSLIEAGASLIIGHHPHIIQGIERYKEGLIAYSLGNFVFDFWQNKLRETLILHCELSKSGIVSYSTTPARIDNDYCPIVLTGDEAKSLSRMVDDLSNKIQSTDLECDRHREKYISGVKTGLLINKVENRLFFIRNILKYEPWVVVQSLKNFIFPSV